MLMNGDLNKIIVEVNKVLEGVFARVEALEDRIMELESSSSPSVSEVKRGPGRPPGAKNKKAA